MPKVYLRRRNTRYPKMLFKKIMVQKKEIIDQIHFKNPLSNNKITKDIFINYI